jgi:hypothetical protein
MHFDFSTVVEAIGACNTPASRRGHFLLGGHSRGQWIRNDDYRCRRGGSACDVDVQVHCRGWTVVVRKVVAAEEMLSMKPLTRASAVQAEVTPMRLLTKASAVEAGVSPMEPLRAADKSSTVEAGVATTAPSLGLSCEGIKRPHSEDESEG